MEAEAQGSRRASVKPDTPFRVLPWRPDGGWWRPEAQPFGGAGRRQAPTAEAWRGWAPTARGSPGEGCPPPALPPRRTGRPGGSGADAEPQVGDWGQRPGTLVSGEGPARSSLVHGDEPPPLPGRQRKDCGPGVAGAEGGCLFLEAFGDFPPQPPRSRHKGGGGGASGATGAAGGASLARCSGRLNSLCLLLAAASTRCLLHVDEAAPSAVLLLPTASRLAGRGARLGSHSRRADRGWRWSWNWDLQH